MRKQMFTRAVQRGPGLPRCQSRRAGRARRRRVSPSDRVARARQDRVQLLLELRVEEAQRELVLLDEIDELLRLVDLGEVAVLLRPARAPRGRHVAGYEGARG